MDLCELRVKLNIKNTRGNSQAAAAAVQTGHNPQIIISLKKEKEE